MNREIIMRIEDRLEAEKKHSKLISGDGRSLIAKCRQYLCQNQIQFYESLLNMALSNTNENELHQLLKLALKLLALEKTRKPSPNDFMTWQFIDPEGNFSTEEVPNNRWSIDELKKYIREKNEDNIPNITGIARFYRIHPNEHHFLLQDVFTRTEKLWEHGLIVTEAQLKELSKPPLTVEFELWRFWPLYTL